MRHLSKSRGFTLIELLVVLIIMGVAAALTAPALLKAPPRKPPLEELIATARQVAARRGETMYLRVEQGGAWRLEGAASEPAALAAAGHVPGFPGLPVALAISPLGSCSFEVAVPPTARPFRLDPLTCRIDQP
ncbi:MAG TPA: type II secretion system protein [Gemmatimonadales bacterium]|jgi:prepilin-type N-terminal cleavage/methylation domain-containing protein|nr:type II secretion system protein [Gemmatimonadales bacterium]